MLQILEISKTFSQALVLPSPTHSNFRSSLMDPTKSWTPKRCLVLLAVGVLQPRFKYQNKSDMCTKNWPKKRWMGFSVPINLFHLSELLQHTWRQLMGCQRVIQLSLGSLVGGTRCLWDHMLGRIPVIGWETRGKNHGINCYVAMLYCPFLVGEKGHEEWREVCQRLEKLVGIFVYQWVRVSKYI